MWEQISNMIENGKTYTEIATYVAKTRYLTSDIYDDEEDSHFDGWIDQMVIWDNILNVCCDIMEEMKIDTSSDYCYDVMERCREVFYNQSYNNGLINDVIIETVSSFIKFLEDKSIGDWHDNLICEYDDDDDDEYNNDDDNDNDND